VPGERVAMFVIHGIGEQKPYETLDQFARGLISSLERNGAQWTIAPALEECTDPLHEQKDWTRLSLRLMPAAPKSQIEDITLFEYYWAPITENKVGYFKSLTFLTSAGLKPLQYLFANVNALDAVQKHKERWTRLLILSKELVRIFFLFVPLVLALGCLAGWLASGTQLTSLLKLDRAIVLLLVVVVIRWMYVAGFAKLLWDSMRAHAGWRGMTSLRVVAVLLITIWLALPYYLGFLVTFFSKLLPGRDSTILRLSEIASLISIEGVNGWGPRITRFFYLSPRLQHPVLLIVGMLAAYVVRLILVDYVGDLAVYLGSDERSENFAARSQILDECSQSLTAILRAKSGNGPAFDRVVIVGHSLGSVIAYDAVNELLDRARSGAIPDPADLRRLSGMVTFGCPLNKVYYFFREQLPPRQEIRRQILDLLHSFRIFKARIADQFTFTGVEPQLWKEAEAALEKDFLWINVWSISDPISGKLLFYDLGSADNQLHLFYRRPLVAHVLYWEDPRFYDFVIQKFLGSAVALVASAARKARVKPPKDAPVLTGPASS